MATKTNYRDTKAKDYKGLGKISKAKKDFRKDERGFHDWDDLDPQQNETNDLGTTGSQFRSGSERSRAYDEFIGPQAGRYSVQDPHSNMGEYGRSDRRRDRGDEEEEYGQEGFGSGYMKTNEDYYDRGSRGYSQRNRNYEDSQRVTRQGQGYGGSQFSGRGNNYSEGEGQYDDYSFRNEGGYAEDYDDNDRPQHRASGSYQRDDRENYYRNNRRNESENDEWNNWWDDRRERRPEDEWYAYGARDSRTNSRSGFGRDWDSFESDRFERGYNDNERNRKERMETEREYSGKNNSGRSRRRNVRNW
jgi:hypothetical protein